ncbi:glycosyltransferase family A protein [Wenyingzhuangia sp. IMCC45467]
MRTGVNPEKFKNNKIHYYQHRVIVPVYIPNLEEEFYKNSFEVLKTCLNSLFCTTESKYTAITIINNNCCNEISEYLESLLRDKRIDKINKYSQNKGKVYSVLSELNSSYEEFITITDADVFFMDNWLLHTINVFNQFSNVAFVSPLPCPSNYKYLNRPLLLKEFFNIKLKRVVSDKSFQLYEEGVNPKVDYFEGKKWNWKLGQYVLVNKDKQACVGATHFAFTLNRKYLNLKDLKGPEFVFRNGDEKKYLEKFIEESLGYRLSTVDTYAYHMGNTLESWVKKYKHTSSRNYMSFVSKPLKNKLFKIDFIIIRMLFKIIGSKIYKN